MSSDLIKRLVIFGLLMEHGEGILRKSPAYVLEKYHAVMDAPYPTNLLDVLNKAKLARYDANWTNRGKAKK